MLGLVGIHGTWPQRLRRPPVRRYAGTPVRWYAGTPVRPYACAPVPLCPLSSHPHPAPERQVGWVLAVGIEGRVLEGHAQ